MPNEAPATKAAWTKYVDREVGPAASASVSASGNCVVVLTPNFTDVADVWFGLGRVPLEIWRRLAQHAHWIPLASPGDIDVQMFDVTLDGSERLMVVFDKSADGQVSHEELIDGLESKGFSNLGACEEFNDLLNIVSVINNKRCISAQQLAWILQRTKLEQLDGMALPGGPCPEHDAGTCGPRSSLSTQCYNAKDFAASAVDEPDAVHQFFLHASDSAKMHGLASGHPVLWIAFDNVMGLDYRTTQCRCAIENRRLLIMMALRYRLHPLGVERVLNLQNERPKRLVFGRCDFLVIPSYRLSPRSARSVAEYSRSIEKSDSGRAHHSSVLSRTAPAVEIEECQLAIFLDNQAWNELIHVQTPWVKAGMRAHTQAQNIDILEKFDGEEARQRPMFADLMGQLSSNYSMLRRGSTQWLQFAMLEIISKNLTEVVDALRLFIIYHQDLLHTEEAGYKTENIKMIIALGDDLENLQRKVRPLRRIMRSVADETALEISLRRYLADLDEDINNSLLDMEQMISQCESLRNEVRTYKEERMNNILYTLTGVTTAFIPAQFLTGVYGMNFYNVQTELSPIPELTWTYGYPMFWVLVVLLSTTISVFVRWVLRGSTGSSSSSKKPT
ncbi:EF-hand domain-containing protein [Plasmodiophora brassicae]